MDRPAEGRAAGPPLQERLRPALATFGIDLPAHPDGPALAYYDDFVARARRAGFTHLWAGDHLLWRRPRLEVFTLLAAAAALPAARGMSAGTAIALAPLRNPAWMAKTAASIHLLTAGRFVLGVGVGGENPDEFAAAGTRVTRRGAATDEAIDAVRQAWAGGLPGFSPLPDPPIPIIVGGRTDASLERAAARGDGWLPLFVTPDRYREMWTRLEAMRLAAGRSGPFMRALTIWAAVDRDSGRAWDAALETAEREYAVDRARFRRYLVAGTPAEVAEQLGAYVEAGAEHVEIHPAHPDPSGQLDLLGEALALTRR